MEICLLQRLEGVPGVVRILDYFEKPGSKLSRENTFSNTSKSQVAKCQEKYSRKIRVSGSKVSRKNILDYLKKQGGKIKKRFRRDLDSKICKETYFRLLGKFVDFTKMYFWYDNILVVHDAVIIKEYCKQAEMANVKGHL